MLRQEITSLGWQEVKCCHCKWTCELKNKIVTQSDDRKISTEIICLSPWHLKASLVAQTAENPPSVQETQVWSCDEKTPWRSKWLPTPGFLPGEPMDRRPGHPQHIGSPRVRHDWATERAHWHLNAFSRSPKWNGSLLPSLKSLKEPC